MARGHVVAAEILRTAPFSAHKGNLGFRSPGFVALTADVTDEDFARLATLKENPSFKGELVALVQALADCGLPDVELVEVLPLLGDGATPAVASERLEVNSAAVRLAMADAERVLKQGSPAILAVDRVHSALHGYLGEVCAAAGLQNLGANPTVGALWKQLRTEHPAFTCVGPHAEQVDKLMKAAAAGVDALGNLRNHGSIAHANANLLDEAEAYLAINFTRSILNYVTRRIASTKASDPLQGS